MASGRKRKRKKPGHGPGPSTPDSESILSDIETQLAALTEADDAAMGPIWGAVHKLLLKTDADSGDVGRIVATRDPDALRGLVGVLRGEPEASAPVDAPAELAKDISADTMKKAMRAFRKRLKLTRLDHESKLGVGPMTGGRRADFDAIMAPQEFPREVWDALVAEGQLKSAGQGFFMLIEPDA